MTNVGQQPNRLVNLSSFLKKIATRSNWLGKKLIFNTLNNEKKKETLPCISINHAIDGTKLLISRDNSRAGEKRKRRENHCHGISMYVKRLFSCKRTISNTLAGEPASIIG